MVDHLYTISVDIYKYEKRTKKKLGSTKISRKYKISTHYAKITRFLVDLFHKYNGTIEDIYSKFKDYEHKYKSLLRQHNNLAKQKSTDDDILHLIDENLDRYIEKLKKINIQSNNIYTANIKNKDKNEEEVVLLLSDWHIGEIVNPEVVSFLNEYNEKIAEERINHIVNKVIELTQLQQNISTINRIHIACLGDMVSGHNLHNELDKTNSLNIAEQVLQTSTLLSSVIIKLSQYFPEIYFYGVPGNHGRTTKKKEYKQPSSSYDYLAYKITEKEISLLIDIGKIKSNIEFIIPKSNIIFTTIQDHNILFSHGDNINIWNSIPYYGILRDYANKQELMLSSYNQPVHYICIGHFHHPITINRPLGGIIINGSLIGVNEFSFTKNLISKPSQTFFGINKKYGRTFLYELYC